MTEIDDLKMILRNADVSCITDAKTNTEQKIRFGECIIFVNGLEQRKAEIRAKAIEEFAEAVKAEIFPTLHTEEEYAIAEKALDDIEKELKGE